MGQLMEIRKTQSTLSIEQREAGSPTIEGYSALFGVETVIYDSFRESISRSAFDKVLAERQDTRALFDHNSSHVLGRVGNGTLSMRTDERGLFASIKPNMEVGYVKDLVENIKRGDITGQSFAFTVRQAKWVIDETGKTLDKREIIDVKQLFDVGPVTYPAYEQTDIAVRKQNFDGAKLMREKVSEYVAEFRSTNKKKLAEIVISSDIADSSFEIAEGELGYSLIVGEDCVYAKRDVPVIKRSTPLSVRLKQLSTLG
jgi:uncharacterized protein